MPRTGLKAEDIREKAIDATIERIRQLGFEKVRLTDIARELHVSHAALYAHFKDKSALLDAVSERWLLELDDKLEAICRRKKDPVERIHAWALALHRAKVEKVSRDPELYRAFDAAAEISKPFVERHMDTMFRQLSGLVREAIEAAGLNKADPRLMTKVILESTSAFHHPRLVAQHLGEKREKLMSKVLDSILGGLGIKK